MAKFTLDNLTSYGTPWEVVEEVALKEVDPKGFKNIESAEVQEKEFEWGVGVSICMMMKGGSVKYLPLSRDSELEVGDTVDIDSITVLTLERDGKTIFRSDAEVAESKPSRGKKK